MRSDATVRQVVTDPALGTMATGQRQWWEHLVLTEPIGGRSCLTRSTGP